MALSLVSIHETFSLYRRDNDEIVGIYHRSMGWWFGGDTMSLGIDAADTLTAINDGLITLADAETVSYDDTSEFRRCEYVGFGDLIGCETVVEDSGELIAVDDQMWCEHHADMFAHQCNRCGIHTTRPGWVTGDTACESCIDEHSSYCDGCDTQYWDHNASRHDSCHGDGESSRCCTSPMLEFSIPLAEGFEAVDGATGSTPRLPHDTPLGVTVGGGVISRLGMLMISHVLQMEGMGEEGRKPGWAPSADGRQPAAYYLSSFVNEVGDEYKTDKGVFAKRLRSSIYKYCDGYKLSDKALEKIGTIAREHSAPVEVNVEITRDVNRPRDEFANEDSCWWTDYDFSRCTLKSNGGFALRDFDGEDGVGYGRSVEGRAWVLPFKVSGTYLVPTLGDADAYLVFNGYETLSERTGPRVLAAMTGWDFTAVGIGGGGWNMYFNGNSGYLVAPSDILKRFGDGMLSLPHSLDMHAHLDQPISA